MNITDKITDYLNENKIDDFVNKFKNKMGKDTTEQTAKSWVDGIGELSKSDKKKLLGKILNYIEA